jgi:DNA polymerase-3 subunit epsilon
MSELPQSVVVCTLEGRVLLYNRRARLQFRALSDVVAGGAELIGLGRSIYAVFDRDPQTGEDFELRMFTTSLVAAIQWYVAVSAANEPPCSWRGRMTRILSVRARDWWSSCEAPPG